MRRILLATYVFLVLLGGGRSARSASSIVNSGQANFLDEVNVAQAPVIASATLSVMANPVLTLVKTTDFKSGVSGTVFTYSLTLGYPQLGASCADDSPATALSVTDTIPAGMTYQANSTSVSIDGGATFGLGTDLSDGVDVPGGLADVSFVANQVRVTFTGSMAECAPARVVKFKVRLN